MQIIALIKQKGRGGKTASKRLTNNLKLFFEKRKIFENYIVYKIEKNNLYFLSSM
jgi:hypothetical protein